MAGKTKTERRDLKPSGKMSSESESLDQKALDRKPFELIASHPVLDFVNTLDDRFAEGGPIELLASYEDLLRFTAQAELIGDTQFRKLRRLMLDQAGQRAALAEAIQLREALADLMYGQVDRRTHPTSVLSVLETAFKEALSHRKLTFASEPTEALTWEWRGIGKNLSSPVWLLAQAANDLLTSPNFGQIRKCASPTCQWLFLDTSKNHKRRWCDMKICGNRNKARLFHQRRAHATHSGDSEIE